MNQKTNYGYMWGVGIMGDCYFFFPLNFVCVFSYQRASQVVLVIKNMCVNVGHKRHRFDPWVRKNSWRRTWQPNPVILPGESHGQRSLVGYSP